MKRVSMTNKKLEEFHKPETLISWKCDLRQIREFGILCSTFYEKISFRINTIGRDSYINIVDYHKRGMGRKYRDFPTILMNNKHLIDMAKLILQALEPESLIESERETLENTVMGE
jgi:hypothetical protein